MTRSPTPLDYARRLAPLVIVAAVSHLVTMAAYGLAPVGAVSVAAWAAMALAAGLLAWQPDRGRHPSAR